MEFIYKCPVCGQKPVKVNKSLVCPQNHSFDFSGDGYVNLLPANQKNSKNPGDGTLMVESRKLFLEKGFYDPLSNQINNIAANLLNAAVENSTGRDGGDSNRSRRFCILDVGCGVGFYSGKLYEALAIAGPEGRAEIYGIDISKPAIQKAAKNYPGINFCVGSSFHLPYLDESFDFIFSIFSPFENKEMLRVLKPGGRILVVRPGENHLKELAEIIYGKSGLRGKAPELADITGVSLVEESRLKYEIHLGSNEDIMNLVAMTPYYWHLNADNKTALAGLSELTASMDFQISLFSKNSL